MTDAISQHQIAGTVLTMPVEIRSATQHMAMFSVNADAAQAMVDHSGLQVCRIRPGKAVVVLMLTHYVDGAFTMEAGRSIWGYPKVLADFTVRCPGRSAPARRARDGHQFSFDVNSDGQFVVGMDFRRGLPVPSALVSKPQVHPTYSHLDGIIRETAGVMKSSGVRYRPGGARVRLGQHPYAKELASLGLSKRAMISSSAENVEMTFADAKEIS